MNLKPAKPSMHDETSGPRDAAVVLAVVVGTVFATAIAVLVLIEFLDKLPGRIGTILVISIVAVGAVLIKAAISRMLATPKKNLAEPPTLRTRPNRKNRAV